MSPRIPLLSCALFLLSTAGAAPPEPPKNVPLPGVQARSIGPATMGGRVTAVAVVEKKPAIQYVGAAAGGVWKTTDHGENWQCVFPGRPHPSIGALAVAPSRPEVVWVGTGEANARNSVSWGNGVFLSRDAGKTWAHVGLKDSRHIGKIVVHPKKPETAYVAALGRLWGKNAERGVFRTTDGGKTWDHVLKLDEDTGAVDLAMNEDDPDIIFAAAYCVRRDGFCGGNPVTQFGTRAGIYRTTDGGKKWARLTRGLPARPLGRIGLAVYRKDPRIVMAVVQTDQTYTARVAGQPPGGPGPVDRGGIFRSTDGGDSWTKTNDLCPRPFYFSQIRIDPSDDQRVYVLGLPLFVSRNGGKTFANNGAVKVHVDHHDLWINPDDEKHMVLGGDGGLYHTRNGGTAWRPIKNLPISQFYGVGLDTGTPYRIYGGLQDNGSWGGPSRTSNPTGILNADWTRVLGMDGFMCQVPPADPMTVFAEGQYGRLHRIDRRNGQMINIQPRPPRQGIVYRFNWCSPLLLSPHDGKTLYFGGNHLFRSADQGQTWHVISTDLTAGALNTSYRHTGHTLTAVAESPVKKGLLYVGSDDGKVHVSHNGGEKWQDVSKNLPDLPAERWITRIECSPRAANTAWLSLTRHRQDDTAPYLFRTDDAGKTWKSIAGNLPAEGHVHVIRASTRHPELLFAGTEFGLFLTFDGGKRWQPFAGGLPPVPVHDLVIHPRQRELVIATHGRGIYIADVAGVEELVAKVRESKVHLSQPREAILPGKPRLVEAPPRTYVGANPPEGVAIAYWLKDRADRVTLEVLSPRGEVVAALKAPGGPGLQQVYWGLRRTAADGRQELVAAGEYSIRLRAAGVDRTAKLRVKAN